MLGSLAFWGQGTEIGTGCRAEGARRSAGATVSVSVCQDGVAMSMQGLSILSSSLPSLEPAFLLLPWQHLPEVLLRASWVVKTSWA